MTAAITIHFRQPELTIACVDSLLADGWNPILVWDNSDDIGTSLQTLERRYDAEPRVLLVPSAENLGFGKGMNAALAELGRRGHEGPVLLVNNDAQVQAGLQSALLAELTDAEPLALVAPRITQDGREQGWLYYQPWLALVTRYKIPGSFSYLSGCCLLVKRPDNVQPLFDEAFFMYGEDVELSWRFQRQGAQLVLLDKSYVNHAGSASSGQASESYESFLLQSHWLLADKLASNASSRMVMRALRIWSLLIRACLRSLRFGTTLPLRTFLNLIR